jgi:trehalose/maltose hydrolase-like predicted phosphorylase
LFFFFLAEQSVKASDVSTCVFGSFGAISLCSAGGYSGHSFWDMETWMFPVLTVLFPELARVAAQYRFDRLAASLQNAAAMGYDGAAWAWESASTGLWTAPWRQADFSENHIDVSGR